MFCRNCGKNISPFDSQCPYCGTPAQSLETCAGFWDLCKSPKPAQEGRAMQPVLKADPDPAQKQPVPDPAKSQDQRGNGLEGPKSKENRNDAALMSSLRKQEAKLNRYRDEIRKLRMVLLALGILTAISLILNVYFGFRLHSADASSKEQEKPAETQPAVEPSHPAENNPSDYESQIETPSAPEQGTDETESEQNVQNETWPDLTEPQSEWEDSQMETYVEEEQTTQEHHLVPSGPQNGVSNFTTV